MSSERVVYKRFYPVHLMQSPNESVLTTHMVLRLLKDLCPQVSFKCFSVFGNILFIIKNAHAVWKKSENMFVACTDIPDVPRKVQART